MGLSPAYGQGAGHKRIKRHEPVIVDFGGSVDGYLVDQTRMFALGDVSARLRKGFDDMCAVQEQMKVLAVPGAAWGAVYDGCLEMALSMGYSESFMGTAGAQVSFIGHGVGVELDEYPFIARGFNEMTLQPGMVFAFEPKLVFPEGAVGIENTFYIANDGSLQQLTISDESFVIL
jgi:Xaa-Pro dipeptidase